MAARGGRSGAPGGARLSASVKCRLEFLSVGSSLSIGSPDGLSTWGIVCILNRWLRPQRENFSVAGGGTVRGPMAMLARCLPFASGRPVSPCVGAMAEAPGEGISR